MLVQFFALQEIPRKQKKQKNKPAEKAGIEK